MTSSVQSLLSDKRTVLSQIRPVVLFIALLFALPAAALPQFSLWFVVSGIISCILVAVYLELKSEQAHETGELLATLPAEYEGLGSFKDVVFLELRQQNQPGQLEMALNLAIQKQSSRRKTATVVHVAGKNHFLVDADRFVAVLLDKMTEDADKVAEHAILMGMKRYGSVQRIDEELHRFLSDRSVIEVIKSDFRGNMLMVINRSGEKVIRELIKKALVEATKSPVLTVAPKSERQSEKV